MNINMELYKTFYYILLKMKIFQEYPMKLSINHPFNYNCYCDISSMYIRSTPFVSIISNK